MRNAEEFFKNSKTDSIEVIGIVKASHVVHHTTWTNYYKPSEKKDYYEIRLECELAGNAATLLKAYNEKKNQHLSKLQSEDHPVEIFRGKTRNLPISPSKTNSNKVCIRAYMPCQRRGTTVNVPIYDVHEASGEDTRSMRAGIEIPNGSKVAVRILLNPYAMSPANPDEKFIIDDKCTNCLRVNDVDVTPYMLSVTIIDEPAHSVLERKVIKSIRGVCDFVYKPMVLSYSLPSEQFERKHIPSLVLDNGAVIEVIGDLSKKYCEKMLALKSNYRALDFRIVFANAGAKILGNSDMTCEEWARKNDFPFADGGQIPFNWSWSADKGSAKTALNGILTNSIIEYPDCEKDAIEYWLSQILEEEERAAQAAREAAEAEDEEDW